MATGDGIGLGGELGGLHGASPRPVGTPATFTGVLRNREFAALFLAHLFSLLGDQLARIALAVLVYDRTSSPGLAALTFAASFLPWLVGAPLLAGLADRFPRRTVMITSDLVRCVLVGVMALPGLGLPALFALLVLVSLLAPPFEAARAALLPDVVPGEDYVVASSLSQISNQAAQFVGFALGGAAVALISARGALLLDAGTFLLSAVVVAVGVHRRPAAGKAAQAGDGGAPPIPWTPLAGVHVVWREPVLRHLVLLASLASASTIAAEGLAVAYVAEQGGGPTAVGLLTGATPAGTVIGAVLVGRFLAPERRLPLLLPLALLATVPLVPTLLHPGLVGTWLLWAVAGVGSAYNLPASAAFVQAVPNAARARAFAVAQASLQVAQGASLALAGLAAEVLPVHQVVAIWGAGGVVAVALLARTWPAELRSAGGRVPPASPRAAPAPPRAP